MSDTPRTPLTLEFQPDNLEDPDTPEEFVPIVVCEPSFSESGRIYLGVNPVGHRLGVHLLPDAARRIRDHLTKLLLETGDDAAPAAAPDGSGPGALARAVPPAQDVQRRIDAAVERIKASKAQEKEPRFQFRLEFRLGRIQGVIGRLKS